MRGVRGCLGVIPRGCGVSYAVAPHLLTLARTWYRSALKTGVVSTHGHHGDECSARASLPHGSGVRIRQARLCTPPRVLSATVVGCTASRSTRTISCLRVLGFPPLPGCGVYREPCCGGSPRDLPWWGRHSHSACSPWPHSGRLRGWGHHR